MINMDTLGFEMRLVDSFHERFGPDSSWSRPIREAFEAIGRLRGHLSDDEFTAYLDCCLKAFDSKPGIRGWIFPQMYARAVFKRFGEDLPAAFVDIAFAYTWFLHILLDAHQHQEVTRAAQAAWEEHCADRSELVRPRA